MPTRLPCALPRETLSNRTGDPIFVGRELNDYGSNLRKTWQYLVLSSDSDEGLAQQLSEAGQEGWDLVNGCVSKDGKATVWSAFLRRPDSVRNPAPARPAAATTSPKAAGETANPPASASDTTKVAPVKKPPAKATTAPPAKPSETTAAPPKKDDTGFDVEDNEDDDSTFDLQL